MKKDNLTFSFSIYMPCISFVPNFLSKPPVLHWARKMNMVALILFPILEKLSSIHLCWLSLSQRPWLCWGMIFLLYQFCEDFHHEGIWILSRSVYASIEMVKWLLILHAVHVILQVSWEACAKSFLQYLCLALLIHVASNNEIIRFPSFQCFGIVSKLFLTFWKHQA